MVFPSTNFHPEKKTNSYMFLSLLTDVRFFSVDVGGAFPLIRSQAKPNPELWAAVQKLMVR